MILRASQRANKSEFKHRFKQHLSRAVKHLLAAFPADSSEVWGFQLLRLRHRAPEAAGLPQGGTELRRKKHHPFSAESFKELKKRKGIKICIVLQIDSACLSKWFCMLGIFIGERGTSLLHREKDMAAWKEDFYISDFGVCDEFKIVSSDNKGKGTMPI